MGQKNLDLPNNSLVLLKKRNFVFRKRQPLNIVNITNGEYIYSSSGKQFKLDKRLVSKTYLADEIFLYKKKKFHYKSGVIMDFNLGGSAESSYANLNIGKRIIPKLDLKIGLGLYNNFLVIPTTGNFVFFDITSIPLYTLVKFQLNKGKRRIYTKAKLGYMNNLTSNRLLTINNSFLLEGKIGLQFSSKAKFKHYLEVGQSMSHAKGRLIPVEVNNEPANIDFDIWFYNFTIGWGIEFGK